jgi:hypothetical protein
LKRMFEEFGLRVFSATVDSFDGDQQSACSHVSRAW